VLNAAAGGSFQLADSVLDVQSRVPVVRPVDDRLTASAASAAHVGSLYTPDT